MSLNENEECLWDPWHYHLEVHSLWNSLLGLLCHGSTQRAHGFKSKWEAQCASSLNSMEEDDWLWVWCGVWGKYKDPLSLSFVICKTDSSGQNTVWCGWFSCLWQNFKYLVSRRKSIKWTNLPTSRRWHRSPWPLRGPISSEALCPGIALCVFVFVLKSLIMLCQVRTTQAGAQVPDLSIENLRGYQCCLLNLSKGLGHPDKEHKKPSQAVQTSQSPGIEGLESTATQAVLAVALKIAYDFNFKPANKLFWK